MLLPCSHVFHVFRSPKYWAKQVYTVPGDEIIRNKRRVAAVWMDEYEALYRHAVGAKGMDMDIGDLSAPMAVRERLQCKSHRSVGCVYMCMDRWYPRYHISPGKKHADER